MSDFSFEFGDGTAASFPQFTVKEYEALQARVAATQKKQNRLLIQEQNLSPADAVRLLKEIDPKSIGPYEIEVFVNDDREARKVLAQSQAKAGVGPEEAEKNIARISVIERATLAKHVVGLMNLSVVPEEDRAANDRMKAVVRMKFGVDADNLKVGEFYNLIAQLVPPEDENPSPAAWFEKNTVAGSARERVVAA